MRELDVLTIGETVIDLISDDVVNSIQYAESFQRYLGGSPTNIAINLAQLGFRTALLSRVGPDAFGDFAIQQISEKGVEISGLQKDPMNKTTVIFVTRTTGTPQVIHYRGADQYLEFTNEARELIDRARIIHFSGFVLSQMPARKAILQMKAYALKQDKLVTFDPCYHDVLWSDPEKGKDIFTAFIRDVTLVKPSMDDLQRLWGPIRIDEGIQRYHQLGAKMVFLTMGKDGVVISDGINIEHIVPKAVEVKDVTGAGDSFWSGLLAGVLQQRPLLQTAKLGMQTAAMTLQHVGAIAPLPHISSLESKFVFNK